MNAALTGISNLVSFWADHRSEFEKTLQLLGERFDEAAEASLAVPADCFMIPENLSSEVVGRFYGKYVRPWEEKWTARIRQAGKHSFIHMDGTLGLIDQVAAAGFDVIEAFTPVPVGDMSIEAARARARSGPVLWGGLPGIYFTPLVDDDEFERFVRETIVTMVRDGRMVLGVADQVPPDGLRARVARVAELVDLYGRYG
jgi:uroporphyrinogen-III decarboxylase